VQVDADGAFRHKATSMIQAIESRQDTCHPPAGWGVQFFDHALGDPGPGHWREPGSGALRVWLPQPRRLIQLIGRPEVEFGDDDGLAAPDVDAWLATHFGDYCNEQPGA